MGNGRTSHVGKSKPQKEYYLKTIQDNLVESTIKPDEIFDATDGIKKPEIPEDIPEKKRPSSIPDEVALKISENIFKAIMGGVAALVASGLISIIVTQSSLKTSFDNHIESFKEFKININATLEALNQVDQNLDKKIQENKSVVDKHSENLIATEKDIERLYNKKP